MLSREPLLGTRGEVHVEATSDEAADMAERAVLDAVEALEQVFSVFDNASTLSELRRTGLTTNADLNEVMNLAATWRALTNRAFDPYCQSLFDAWDQAESVGRVPEQSNLVDLISNLGQPEIATLNLNAIAKGWIGERSLTAALENPQCTAGWVSLGGDLIHRGQATVIVGIENPLRPYDNEPPLARIEVSNEALATSGGARRWWTVGNQRWPKVLDPRTGWPVDRVASATVVASSAADADALATVLLVLSEDEGRALLEDQNAVAFIVNHDGTILSTSQRFVTQG